jgi:hypothetical protein
MGKIGKTSRKKRRLLLRFPFSVVYSKMWTECNHEPSALHLPNSQLGSDSARRDESMMLVWSALVIAVLRSCGATIMSSRSEAKIVASMNR